MKKLGLILLTLTTTNVFAVEIYECRFSEPELKGMVQEVEVQSARNITTSMYEENGESFVKDAPCDIRPTGNGKMSLTCYAGGETMNILLDTKALTLESSVPWIPNVKFKMDCVKHQ